MRPKILIVDNDMMIRSILEVYIEQSGFEWTGSASNEQETLELLEKKFPDVILMDIHSHNQSNRSELASKIHKKYNLPIVYISTDPDKKILDNSILPNVYGYLHKPIHRNNFISTIYFAIAKHKINTNAKK